MRVDQLLGKHNIYFKESSGEDYLIHCVNPEHQDSNPSMRIDRTTGAMHCFSCGYKGNIFREYEEAADYSNIYLVRTLTLLHRLMNKGMEIPDLATNVQEPVRGVPVSLLSQYGAFTHDEYPDRVMFPVRDIAGDIKGLLGRHLDEDTVKDKYMIYPKKVTLPIFPSNPKIRNNELILTEGIFDVFALNMAGVHNASAALGTHTMFKQWREKLMPLKELKGVHTITLIFDGDKAGATAARKLAEIIEKEFAVRILHLPNGKDIAELSTEEMDELMEKINGKK